jgi:hypothetical protein
MLKEPAGAGLNQGSYHSSLLGKATIEWYMSLLIDSCDIDSMKMSTSPCKKTDGSGFFS